jgi:predicted 3-demethylubiquinone-9 3-methyltransferase (glyoxalase superfamily)
MQMSARLTPCLWFDSEAEEAQIHCQTQGEVDYFWSKLAEGGKESQCGWLKDKFGLSWQVIPDVLPSCSRTRTPRRQGVS